LRRRHQLSPYDVVFLGEVGLGPGELTPGDYCRLPEGLVEYQASGLLFMAGWLGRQPKTLLSFFVPRCGPQ
jgi:hypothetical protein